MKRNPKRKKNAVPLWAEESMAGHFENLSICERHQLAEELEAKAANLRGYQQKALSHVASVTIELLPEQKKAAIAFWSAHTAFSDKNISEELQATVGCRWILETAMTMLVQVGEMANALTRYGGAEGLTPDHLHDAKTAQALTAFKKYLSETEDVEDEQE